LSMQGIKLRMSKKQAEGVTLRVARAHHQSEVGLGRARIDSQTRIYDGPSEVHRWVLARS